MINHGVANVEALALKLQGHMRTFCEAVGKGDGRRRIVKVRFVGHRRGTGVKKWRDFIVEPLMACEKDGYLEVEMDRPEPDAPASVHTRSSESTSPRQVDTAP